MNESDDTIRRQDAIEEIARWIGYLDEDMILRIQTGLKKLPSAQPEIIRCSECKFSKCIEPNDDWYECQHDKRVNHSNGYCNWAERREK